MAAINRARTDVQGPGQRFATASIEAGGRLVMRAKEWVSGPAS